MGTRVKSVAASIAAALVGAIALAGCLAVRGGGDPGPDTPGTSSTMEVQVTYYPACGNETLEHNGVTWYPFVPDEDWEEPIFDGPLDDATAQASGALTIHGGRGMARVPLVAAPGPGDDIGTLIIYDNGVAYWRSDSGQLETWLTTTPIEYTWVC